MGTLGWGGERGAGGVVIKKGVEGGRGGGAKEGETRDEMSTKKRGQ